MSENFQIRDFTTRVRLLILTLKEERKKTAELNAALEETIQELDHKKEEVRQLRSELRTIKVAHQLSNASNEEVKDMRKRIMRMSREISKCINIINANTTSPNQLEQGNE